MAVRTFLKLHRDLLRNPEYLEFMTTPAHVTYLFVLERAYRPPREGPPDPGLLGFWNARWMVARFTVSQLTACWGGKRSRRSVEGDMSLLEEKGLLDVYDAPEGGGVKLAHLGSWGIHRHPNGRTQRVEVLYADRIFGGLDPEEWPYDG